MVGLAKICDAAVCETESVMTDVERIRNIAAEEISGKPVNMLSKWAIAMDLLLGRKMHKLDLIVENFNDRPAEPNKV